MFLGVTYTAPTSAPAPTRGPVVYAPPGALPMPIREVFTYTPDALETGSGVKAPAAAPTSPALVWIIAGVLAGGVVIVLLKRRRRKAA